MDEADRKRVFELTRAMRKRRIYDVIWESQRANRIIREIIERKPKSKSDDMGAK